MQRENKNEVGQTPSPLTGRGNLDNQITKEKNEIYADLQTLFKGHLPVVADVDIGRM